MASLQLQNHAQSSVQHMKKAGILAFRFIKPEVPHNDNTDNKSSSDQSNPSTPEGPRPRIRLPGLPKAPRFKGKPLRQLVREHTLAAIGEFFGTATFIGLSIAGVCSCNYNVATFRELPYQDASKGYSSESYQYIATSNGLTGLVTIWICFRISGAFFNPAISLANWLAGTCNLTRTCVLFVSQVVGGIAGTAVTLGLSPDHCSASPALSPNTSLPQGVFIEMFITSLLVFAALYGFRQRTKATFLSPILIGLVIFANILAAGPFTGAAQNPVRAFAPALITGTFEDYHWVYWVGPLLGGLLGSLMYRSISWLHKNLPSGNETADTTMEEAEHIQHRTQVQREEVELGNGQKMQRLTTEPTLQKSQDAKTPKSGGPEPAAAGDIWGSDSDTGEQQSNEPGFSPATSPGEKRVTNISAFYEDEKGNRIAPEQISGNFNEPV